MPFQDLEKRKEYQRRYQTQRRQRLKDQQDSSQAPSLAPYFEQVKAALEGLKTAVLEAGQANRQEPWRNRVNREVLKTLQAIARVLETLNRRV